MSSGYPVVNQGLDPGDNQRLDLKETSGPGTYLTYVGATSGADIVIGNPGAAGNKLLGLSVFNNSGSSFTAFTVKDGATTLTALDLGTLRTLGTGSYATWTPPSGALESKNGAWRINITCAGTMANIAVLAVVAEGS